VTFEEWIGVAENVLKEVGEALVMLMSAKAGERIFQLEHGVEVRKQNLEDFEDVM
jgi:hypothetical protein